MKKFLFDTALRKENKSHSLSKTYSDANFYFTIITFIASFVVVTGDTFVYFINHFRFLLTINICLIVLLVTDFILFLKRKLNLDAAFKMLLYTMLLNVSISHWYEIVYNNFLSRSVLVGFWGLLFVVLSGLVLGGRHPYFVMVWAFVLLTVDIIRTKNGFLLQTVPGMIITMAAMAYGISTYMKLLKTSFRRNEDALAEISAQKDCIEKQSIELEAKNKNLSELQSAQKFMTEMIIHDLKNPLNSILINSSSDTTKPEQRSVYEAGRQMLLMVENILEVHHMETAELKLNNEEYNLSEAILNACKQVEYLVQQRFVTVEIQVDSSIFVIADPDILIRIVINLLTNAIKHSPENTILRIFSESDEKNDLILSIQDQGEGIPDMYKETVFDRFVQVISRRSGSARSTGLGLTFCRMSIERMKGKIWISRSSPEGTTVSFTLPTVRKGESSKALVVLPDHRICFSPEDHAVLMPVVKKLREIEIYDAGRILQQLDKLPSGSIPVSDWIEAVKGTVYSSNRKSFDELLEMAASSC